MQSLPLSQSKVDINQFKKVKRINKGGFGTIYSVQNKKDGKIYAAKIIDCGDDEDQCKKIIDREVSIMLSVQHKTLIKFYGYSILDFQDEHNVTIIMEFAVNKSLSELFERIQNDSIPDMYTNTNRQILLIGISKGLKYLHDRNIIHRDVKSGNILLDSEYRPFITDFGMSKYFNVGHSYSQSLYAGTLAYMPPEIIDGKPYDRKADVYSFGILMYEIVTDSFPFPELKKENVNDREFKNKIVEKNYRPKFHIPIKKTLQNLIECCWSNDPNERPDFKEIFLKLITKEFFLDNVDGDKVKNYINEITEINDPVEELLRKGEETEKEIQQLTTEKELLKKNNEKMENQIEKLLKENQVLIEKLNNDQKMEDKCNKINNEQSMPFQMEINISIDESDSSFQKDNDENKESSDAVKLNKLDQKEIVDNSNDSIHVYNEITDSNKVEKSHIQKEDNESNEFDQKENSNDSNCSIHIYNEKDELDEENNESNKKSVDIFQKTENEIPIQEAKGEFAPKEKTENENYQPDLKIPFQGENFNNDLSQASMNKIDEFKPDFDLNPKEIESLYSNKQKSSDVFQFEIEPFKPNFNNDDTIQVDSFNPDFNDPFYTKNINNSNSETDDSNFQIRLGTFKPTIKNFANTSNNNEKTIDDFNHLPFDTQQFYIIESIARTKSKNSKNFLKKIYNLMLFLLPYMHPKSQYIKILSMNTQTLLTDIDEECQIKLLQEAIYNVFYCYLEDTLPFIDIIKSFKHFVLEIKYPTQSFEYLFDKIISLKLKLPNIIKIGIFISGIESITQQFYKNKFIEYFIIDSNVSKISSVHLKGSFQDCSSLTSISIPSSVTFICNFAFKGCSSLKHITIPPSITSIGESTFEGCSSLERITIPSSIIEIGLNAFKGCSSLDFVSIPSTVVKLGASVFSNCSKLESIEILSNITKIENSFFSCCTSLKQIEIPSSVTEICFWSFRNCSSLTHVSIPSSVVKISDSAFIGCSLLQHLIIPSSVTCLGSNVFNDCISLTTIEIPSSVNKIGSFVFNGCSSLKEISIPSSITEIPDWTFNECSSLELVSMPSSIKSIGKGAFCKCKSLLQVCLPNSIKEIKRETFYMCSSLAQIVIPSSVLSIGESAFRNCSSLKQISIPTSVYEIGDLAFGGCSSLKEISIPSSIKIENLGFESRVKLKII